MPRVELIHGFGLLLQPDLDLGGGKSTAHTLVFEISRVYTSRCPRRERSSAELLSAESGKGSIFRAERLIRQIL